MAEAMTAALGHNDARVRLDLLAEDFCVGFARVEKGAAEAIEGWLICGDALNAGRAQFHPEDDKGFGEWVANLLSQVATVTRDERAAAMWAAKDRARFEAVRAEHPGTRTVRGLHKKWLVAKAEREAEESRQVNEAERKRAEDDRESAVLRTQLVEATHRTQEQLRPPPELRVVTDDDEPSGQRKASDVVLEDHDVDRFVDPLVGLISALADDAELYFAPETDGWALLVAAIGRGGHRRDVDIRRKISIAHEFLNQLHRELPHED